MARFVTSTVGGSWTGGGTDVPNCSATQRRRINTALTTIQGILDGWNLPCLNNVRNLLQDRLDCSLEIDCNPTNCGSLRGFTASRGSSYVALCNPALTDTQQGLTATLFHEMVHSVGGTELDAEALENHFFGGSGATPPSSGDWSLFQSDGGEFVIWDQTTGNVFERCLEGGSWDSPPTVTQGLQLAVNFVDPSPPGGGSWI